MKNTMNKYIAIFLLACAEVLSTASLSATNLTVGFYVDAISAASPQTADVKAKVSVTNISVEGRQDNPLGLDIATPRFGWQIISSEKNVLQTGYHILVASSAEKLAKNEGDLWDADVKSAQSLWIDYGGTALKSNQYCYWKVQVSTNKGKTAWSEAAEFSIGLLNESHWRGSWIGLDRTFAEDVVDVHSRLSARYYRSEFKAENNIKRATLHICGLGLYEAYINGTKVGNDVMTPAPTDYRKSIGYNTYDVTNLVNSDNNCIGATVSNGRYYTMQQGKKFHKITNFGFPTLRANLIIEYANGKTQTIATDDKTWKITADGPIRSSNEYDGEIYDARKEASICDWSKTGFDDSAWLKAERSAIPQGELRGNITPAMQIVRDWNISNLTEQQDGSIIADCEQNFAGWVSISLDALNLNTGDTLSIQYAEKLNDDGTLYTANLRNAQSTDYYIAKGNDKGSWAPKFTTHGGRYVRIKVSNGCVINNTQNRNIKNSTTQTGSVKVLHKNNISAKACLVSDKMQTLGSFESSDTTLNKVVKAAYEGIIDNYKGMPMDCCQRDERMPWLGDHAMGCWGESYLVDNQHLYNKWLTDIEEAQRSDGCIPDVAPAFWNYYTDNVSWPSVFVFAADMLYTQFGDRSAIEKHYPAMRKWLMHFYNDKRTSDGCIHADKYGDWCMPPESLTLIHSQDPTRVTNGDVIATCYFYKLLEELIKFDDVLIGNNTNQLARRGLSKEILEEDKVEYIRIRNEVREAFNKKYLHVTKGTSLAPDHILYPDSIFYDNNTVTSNLMPLAFGMVPEEYEADIERQVMRKHLLLPEGTSELKVVEGHISCGVIGTQWLMRELAKMGRMDVAWMLATNKTYPSWGYMIENGATTIWELWNGNTANPAMNSGNHVMLLGDLIPWCFENIGGIKAAAPGYSKIRLAPDFEAEEIPYANVSYNTPYGLVVSNWKRTNAHLTWDIEIPCNTTAEVVLPYNIKEKANTTKDKSKATKEKTNVTNEKSHILNIGSGTYHLEYDLEESLPMRDYNYNGGAYERLHADSLVADRKGIVKDEFVYTDAEFPSCHASTIAECSNGDLITAFFGGSYEGCNDVCIWTSRKRKIHGQLEDGWSAPEKAFDGVLSDTLRKACYNPVLYQIPGGDLLLFFKIGKNVQDWTSYLVRSKDNGHTWSERERIQAADGVNPDSLLGAIKNQPIQLGKKIIAPSSKERKGWRSYMEISEDDGHTWRLVGPIPQPKHIGTIQPTILVHKDGRLQVLCRSHRPKPGEAQYARVATSFSSDGGETWSPMQLIDSLPNNNSGIDAVTLSDGRFALVYNPFGMVPGPDKPLRNPCCIAISKDGLHWKHVVTLEDSPISQYSYPSMILGSDGCLHVVYTWRRQRIKYAKVNVKELLK